MNLTAKRIIALLLAMVLMFGFVFDTYQQVQAAPAAAAGLALGILAFNLLGVITGRYDDCAEAIGCFIENGVEGWEKAFIGSEDTPSWFITGWNVIYNNLTGMYEAGEIYIDPITGNVQLTYSQYLMLIDSLAEVVGLDVVLGTSVDYVTFSYYTDVSCRLASAPKLDSYHTDIGQSYIPIYYNDSDIYLGGSYVYTSMYYVTNNDGTEKPRITYYLKDITYNGVTYSYTNQRGFQGQFDSYDSVYDKVNPCFFYQTSGYFSMYYDWVGNIVQNNSNTDNWFKFDGSISTVSADDIPSDCEFGYLLCEGDYTNLLSSITSYAAVPDTDGFNDLSDPLEPILDIDTDPTIEVDVDPDISYPDNIKIIDVPGYDDIALPDLLEDTDLDLDIPSVIADKFPFCIPFDFIRIISILCADPVAPVIRIPISTDIKNVEPFLGNQTLGDFDPEKYDPMFEINEEIVIDLSVMPIIQPICHTIFYISFAVMLIMITRKLISH